MSRDKEVGKVVSAVIFLLNNQYSFLVELLGVLTVMFVRKRLVKKRLLLLMSCDSKMLIWSNDFMNGNMIPEECKENFRKSERLFYILCEDLQTCSQS